MEGVAFCAFQSVPAQPAIIFHVPDCWFNGAVSPNVPLKLRTDAAFEFAVVDLDTSWGWLLGSPGPRTLPSAGAVSGFPSAAAQRARYANRRDCPAGCTCQPLALPGVFAFGDALRFRCMQAVELVTVFGLLLEQAPHLNIKAVF
ncbi:hypothetical protein SAMN05216308_11071 [Nitrosospira sp. Nsp13]|nr:hypothetical protein SAMN05216308_11071 [Nitrosospira sp. Nsp13]